MEKPRQCFWKQPNIYIFVFSCAGHDDDDDDVYDDDECDDDTDKHDNDRIISLTNFNAQFFIH